MRVCRGQIATLDVIEATRRTSCSCQTGSRVRS